MMVVLHAKSPDACAGCSFGVDFRVADQNKNGEQVIR